MKNLNSWKRLDTSKNQIEADILRSYLQSFGIEVMLKNEAIGKIYGLVSGPLAEVEFWVPDTQYKHAQELLEVFNGSNNPTN